MSFTPCLRRLVIPALALIVAPLALLAAPLFPDGENVRLTRSEMLQLKGKNLAGGAKGQEFTVLKHDQREGSVYVAWYQDDGTRVAASLPAEALEASPSDAWSDLMRGARAFRERRYEESRRLLARAGKDPKHGALANALATRINGALTAAATGTPAGQQARVTTLQALRDAAVQLTKLGHLSLAMFVDEGADALTTGLAAPPVSKLDRKELEPRVAAAERALHRGRQSIGSHRLHEAAQLVKAGLEAEPGRADLDALQKAMAKDLAYAEESFEAANRMRRFEKGAIHALSAIERGLKVCSDHPQLRALKKEMQSAFEERTSPPVTAAFLTATKATNKAAALTEGHKLYTNRCTECHDLELVDSRSMEGWSRTVGGMAGRAGLSATEQAKILEYIAAAQTYVEATGGGE